MCYHLRLSLLFLFTIYQCLIVAQKAHFKSITEADGLSHAYVSTLFQDSRGFVWIGTIYGLNRYDGYQCKSYLPNHLDPWSLHSNIISAIQEDQNGLLWIGTEDGLVLFDSYSERMVHLRDLTPDAPFGVVKKIVVDPENNIWCYSRNTQSATLVRIQNTKDFLLALRKGQRPTGFQIQPVPLPDPTIRLFFQTTNNTCLIADHKGRFYQLDLLQRVLQNLPNPLANGQPLFLTSFHNPKMGAILFPEHDFSNPLAPDDRIGLLFAPNGQTYISQFYQNQVYETTSLSNLQSQLQSGQLPVATSLPQPSSIAKWVDRQGNIWLGTAGGGLQIISFLPNTVSKLFPNTHFCNPTALPNQTIWAGKYRQDVALNLASQAQETPIWQHVLPHNHTVNSALFVPEEQAIYLVLTLANQQLQLNRFSLPEKSLHPINGLSIPTSGDPVQLLRDRSGNILVSGTGGQLIRYHHFTRKIDHWSFLDLFLGKVDPNQLITRTIAEDAQGAIWIGNDHGLVRMTPQQPQPIFKAYHNYSEQGPLFKANGIFSVCPDRKNPYLLWLGTLSGGLAQFNTQTEQVHYIQAAHPLKFDIVLGIIPDSSNNLWLSTNKGLFCYRPATSIFVNYNELGYLPKNDFDAAAHIALADSLIFFGGSGGLLAIRPNQATKKLTAGQLHLTQISINRQAWNHPDHAGKVLIDANNHTQITLNHLDKLLSIEFALPLAPLTEILLYRYRLVGINQDWIHIGQEHTIEFNGLAPGDYELEIEAIYATDDWDHASKKSIHLRVLPAWYQSKIAYLAYLLLFSMGIWIGFRYQRKRLAGQYQADLDRKEKERLQSLDALKNKFYAYVAHEFKTPLTIMMGASQLLKRNLPPGKNQNYTESILKEGKNLLQLIEEMIGVTRLEGEAIQPNYEQRDLVPLLENLVAAYQPLTDLYDVELMLECSVTQLDMDIDRLRIQYVLNNLLSNALQHTPPKGKIKITLDKTNNQQVTLAIQDAGSGIHPDDLPHIFEKYYRGFEAEATPFNYGLGLSFVKELTELLQGTIQVESSLGKGTTFRITLPIRTQAPKGNTSDTLADEPALPNSNDSNTIASEDAPQLLLVDDNASIQSYLKQLLQPHFRLLFAQNGEEGLEMAIEEIPDLILSDVIMPYMDGIEMTHQIKMHQLTSHIPVVLLSAKNEVADRISGKQQGADAYIGKPFNDQELLFTLQNLIHLQQKWKERYANRYLERSQPTSEPTHQFATESLQATDSFMESIYAVFEENYASESFDSIQLCRQLHISKTQLYRKLASISDTSAMELLRNFRLQKAMELLQQDPTLSTKEVAFRVGFKERSHFSTLFTKKFNRSPSDVRKKG